MSDSTLVIGAVALLATGALLLLRRHDLLAAAWAWLLALYASLLAAPASPPDLFAHRSTMAQALIRQSFETTHLLSAYVSTTAFTIALLGLVLSLYGQMRR